jgi:hypothetical protein
MSTTLSVVLFVGFPLIGALCAIFGQYARPWQVLFGAVAGAAVADVIFGIVSKHTIRSAMSGQAVGVVIWSTEIDWTGHLVAHAMLLTLALVVGGFVLLIRRFATPPNR